MKLEVLQENLSRGLSTVSRVLATRPQMAILSNVLLQTKNGQLEIIASNLETTITTSVGAKIEAQGEFTVPGRTLQEVVSGLAAEKLTLALDEGNLLISGGKFKAKLAGTPAAEFPKLTEGASDKSLVWKLEKNVFLEAVGRTVFSAATDESRAVLTGVLFNATSSGITLAATDGFRLSVIKLPVKSPEEVKFILPAKTLTEVSRILAENKDKDEKESEVTMTLLAESNQVIFDTGEVKIYSRLIAGNFPDFEKIIPPNSTIKIVITGEELLKSIKLASVFARDAANIVKLKIEGSKLKISANAASVGENESEIDLQKEKGSDEEFAIAFNFHYLLDLLNCVDSQEITAEFTGPLASGVFRLPKDENFLHLIMPVRVQT